MERRQRRVFPESFKREAVDRVATSGLSAGRVAAELGLHRMWVDETDFRWSNKTAAVAMAA